VHGMVRLATVASSGQMLSQCTRSCELLSCCDDVKSGEKWRKVAPLHTPGFEISQGEMGNPSRRRCLALWQSSSHSSSQMHKL
jgi:hypothetical protein